MIFNRKIHLASLLLVLGILTSCATTSKEVMLPSGELGIDVRCEENLRNCYKEATKSCPNGYDIKDKVTSSNYLVPVYNLMIICK